MYIYTDTHMYNWIILLDTWNTAKELYFNKNKNKNWKQSKADRVILNWKPCPCANSRSYRAHDPASLLWVTLLGGQCCPVLWASFRVSAPTSIPGHAQAPDKCWVPMLPPVDLRHLSQLILEFFYPVFRFVALGTQYTPSHTILTASQTPPFYKPSPVQYRPRIFFMYLWISCICNCVHAASDSATPWTVAHQASLSVEFSWQEDWSGLPFPPPGVLPSPGSEPHLLHRQADSLPPSHLRSMVEIFVSAPLMGGTSD